MDRIQEILEVAIKDCDKQIDNEKKEFVKKAFLEYNQSQGNKNKELSDGEIKVMFELYINIIDLFFKKIIKKKVNPTKAKQIINENMNKIHKLVTYIIGNNNKNIEKDIEIFVEKS